jgi:hypothetical protein
LSIHVRTSCHSSRFIHVSVVSHTLTLHCPTAAKCNLSCDFRARTHHEVRKTVKYCILQILWEIYQLISDFCQSFVFSCNILSVFQHFRSGRLKSNLIVGNQGSIRSKTLGFDQHLGSNFILDDNLIDFASDTDLQSLFMNAIFNFEDHEHFSSDLFSVESRGWIVVEKG